MTTLAWYAPEDRIIDLGRLTPADYETITALQGQIRRSDRILLCTRPGADPEMLIWSRGGRFWARHFPGGGHGPHLIALMSPEHIRATDYAIRAAEDAGYTTVPEAVTDNRTRLDAVIYGPGVSQVTGIEVQATAITKRTVLARTTRSSRATALKGACAQPLPRGVLPLWFPLGGHEPDWFPYVPSIRTQDVSWDVLPGRRTATAIGPRVIEAKRCGPPWFPRCPAGRRWCGRWHPRDEPRLGLTVDDVVSMVPAGQLVPVKTPAGRNHAHRPEQPHAVHRAHSRGST